MLRAVLVVRHPVVRESPPNAPVRGCPWLVRPTSARAIFVVRRPIGREVLIALRA